MGIARLVASRSYCNRLKVGAIIVKDGNVIAIGYNGTPSGWSNNCEDDSGKTREEVLHAESNAIAKCARSVSSSDGAHLYVTHSPCVSCAKLIMQAGITKVYYGQTYRDLRGIGMLIMHDIECEQVVDASVL